MDEDQRIVLSKSLSTSVASPIDTYRQNRLTHKALSPKKVKDGVWVSLVSSFLISYPCQKVIRVCEDHHMAEICAVILGVCVSNFIKSPLVFNYKRAQTGLRMTTRIPIKSMTKVSGISMIEDIVEECLRYSFTNYNKNNASFKNSCQQSMMLFSMSYPFDLVKNREYYGIRAIRGSRWDFISKLCHKNIQNVLYFQMVNGLTRV